MGDVDERLKMASSLLADSFCGSLAVIEPTTINVKVVDSLSQDSVEYNVLECKRKLQALGVSTETLTVIHGPSRSTVGEAVLFARYCKQNENIKKAMVVTSTYHSARAKAIFQFVFEKEKMDVELVFPYNKHSRYTPTSWFLYKKGYINVFTEELKWINFIAKDFLLNNVIR